MINMDYEVGDQNLDPGIIWPASCVVLATLVGRIMAL